MWLFLRFLLAKKFIYQDPLYLIIGIAGTQFSKRDPTLRKDVTERQNDGGLIVANSMLVHSAAP